ncbi:MULTISPECIES: PEP-CTERM sorting domain-containing protein [unclassified Microcoleus]|uniref:PEP-CTERM sorting domain-containing protein n=1 Tax=unclassified Microcoleus TaxID=2642155 RepID=UPI002FD497BF
MNTLEKITSPLKAYNPNQIIKDIEFKPELSNNKRTISFNFGSQNNNIPIELGTLAKALGYEYFNYLQIISGVPESETWWDGNGKRVVDKGKITTSKGTGAFFDLLPGGNLIYTYDQSNLNQGEQLLINKTQLSPEIIEILKNNGHWVKADTQPFYNDVPGYGGKQPGNWGTYEEHADLYNVSMEDTPFSGTNPNNHYRLFHTLLVGVKDKGKTFHLLEGLSKHWSSNTTCYSGLGRSCTGGISGGPSELLPEFTTGGIEILDDSVTFDELPDDVIALLTSSGGKLINTDGSEYIRNQDAEAVPEPSSILGLMMALGVGAAMKRKFR